MEDLNPNWVMSNQRQQIEEFFSSYEEHFNNALSGGASNIEEILAQSFANCFIESSPLGVNCGKNDEQFPDAIRKGIAFYKSIGSESMHITNTHITFLDELHAMCKVSWTYTYLKNEQTGTIDFAVIYFVRLSGDGVKIFAYIAGDEQKALRESGLV